MNTLYLGLAIHNHQPVGNFPSVFEDAYRDAYLPMVQALEQHPGVRLCLHYSGPLLDWFRQHRPEFVQRIARLAQRGQVELMTGGYYEPILPAIPAADQEGQIRKMNQVLVRDFGSQATGLWLAERVWEPHLPMSLAAAGVEWTLVDDSHFQMVGMDESQLLGYYLTEEEGHSVKIFPSLKALRYSIPWWKVEDVLARLRALAEQGDGLIAVMGDDGEKFGVWPETKKHCWEQGWVDRFFSALEANTSWLKTAPLGEYARRSPPKGRVYLPTASYPEMLEWALPTQQSQEFERVRKEMEQSNRADVLRYLHGGFWRSFLVKYPEANALHKKMLRVHDKVYQARKRSPRASEAALEELWQGQCNCAYWHGVFGGLYLTDVRAALYRHLIAAENLADAVLHPGGSWLQATAEDYDRDGQKELLVESQKLCMYLRPQEGGVLSQWDLRPQRFNLQSTLARRPEPYHQALAQVEAEPPVGEEGQVQSIHHGVRVKEAGLARQLAYDPFPRHSFTEHFLPGRTSMEQFRQVRYRERGDFLGRPFQWALDRPPRGLVVRLERQGRVRQGGRLLPVQLAKSVRVASGRSLLVFRYTILNQGRSPLQCLFASEWNVNLLGGGHNPHAFFTLPGSSLAPAFLDSAGEFVVPHTLLLENRGLDVRLRVRPWPRARAWRFPVETISNSEGGLERVYQATCLVFLYSLDLAPGQSADLVLRWDAPPANQE